MEQFVPLEVWAIMVAAPCLISWYLGELHGAGRIRKLIGETDLPEPPAENREIPAERTMIFGPRDVGTPELHDSLAMERSSRMPEPSGRHPGKKEHVATQSLQKSVDPIQSRRRRETFDGMPSIAELHAQAQAIRASGAVWDDPDLQENLRETDPISARVLQHYLGSINELVRRNAQIDDEVGEPVRHETGTVADEMPRLSDAAPLELRSAKNAYPIPSGAAKSV